MNTDNLKKEIGTYAAMLVKNGTTIGLGTGSTAHCFIKSLAKRFKKELLDIKTCATSIASEKLAKELGLPVYPLDEIKIIHTTFDGADEVDPKKDMIKGAGGALLREKIMAQASKELVILVDETKCVKKLGRGSLPVEVVPFGHLFTAQAVKKLGVPCSIRYARDGSIYRTDNGNYIYDIPLKGLCISAKKLEAELKKICGVIETGFFFSLASRVIIGYTNGLIKVR